MDWFLCWFLFPVSMLVATTAMLSGIGGAAPFTPIFLIVFPLLGPDYPLASAVAAIGVALLTETFGFSSGFVGYYRKRLIDFRGAGQFVAVGVPVAIAGALLAQSTDLDLLKASSGLLMLILAVVMARHHGAVEPAVATSLGAFLTGMVSVGIGEVVMPQLAKRNRVPIPVAAATSVLIVIIVVAAASFTQISAMIAAGGLGAVPWNLVCYTIPGVIIGGRIGSRLQGRIGPRTMEHAIGAPFAVIGVSMLWIVWSGPR